MKDEYCLIFFVILLFVFILCSFLSGNETIEGMEDSYYSKTFYGENGASAQFQKDTNGNYSLIVTTSNGTTTYTRGTTDNTYTGPDGATATIHHSNNITVIKVKDKNGNIVLILTNNQNTGNSSATTQNGTTTSSYDNYNHYNGTSIPSVFYGLDGATAKVIQTPNNNTIVITNKNGTTEIYYIDKDSTDPSVSTYYGPNGGSAKMITDSNGNKAVEITTSDGSKIVYTGDNVYTGNNSQDDTINQYDSDYNTTGTDVSASTYYGPYGGQTTTVTGPSGNTYSSYDSSAYYNSQSNGITRAQIPSGDEDLYILKSQIVPPVCPKCSPVVKCSDNFDATKCAPCKPCGRCELPPFECKKVPTYNAFNPDIMPVPVLTDFSGFGM